MKCNNIHHIAINVKDMEKSILFYKNVMRLKLEREVDMLGKHFAYLKIAENQFLELVAMDGIVDNGRIPDEQRGPKHFAFTVDDVEAWSAHLEKNGVEITNPVTKLMEIDKKVLLFVDPDGSIVELCETMGEGEPL